MNTLPMINCPQLSDLFENPSSYSRHSLKIIPQHFSNIGSVARDLENVSIFAVYVDSTSDSSVETHLIAEFTDLLKAEKFRKSTARLLDVHGELADAAMSLWEATLERMDDQDDVARSIRNTRRNFGTAELRDVIGSFAEACDLQWFDAFQKGEFDDPFDWDWCPKFLNERLVWDPEGETPPTLKAA